MNREDFPMLNKPFIYFNNAATTYKPNIVITKISEYYQSYNVNLGRGVSDLSYKVTEMYEDVRENIAKWLNVKSDNIVFTRGTTESINLVANHFKRILKKGDEILVSNEEHHAVFVTMQQLCLNNGFIFKVVDFEDIETNISNKTKVVAISHYTNVLGKRSNLEAISKLKDQYDFYFLVDGAQGICHETLNLSNYQIDFYAFSAHKLYGPNGVGVLYSKIFNEMEPYHYGGEMVDIVTINNSTFKTAPHKFEAGTMMIPEVLGMGTAIDYLQNIGISQINNHIKKLRNYLIAELKQFNDIIIYNENVDCHFITFNIKNIHAHDIATLLDKNNVIVRAGHHCAAPLMQKLKTDATIRISIGLYNNMVECQKLIAVLKKRGTYLDEIFK